LRLGACYRAVAADLAFARRRFPADPIVGRLELLTQRGRHAGVRRATVAHHGARVRLARLWRAVRERPALLVIAIACLAVPTWLAGYWAWRDPGPASGLRAERVPVGDGATHSGKTRASPSTTSRMSPRASSRTTSR